MVSFSPVKLSFVSDHSGYYGQLQIDTSREIRQEAEENKIVITENNKKEILRRPDALFNELLLHGEAPGDWLCYSTQLLKASRDMTQLHCIWRRSHDRAGFQIQKGCDVREKCLVLGSISTLGK
jgi:hypothetical protein